MTDEFRELQETFRDKLPMIMRFSQFMAGKNEDLYQEGLLSTWRGLLKDPQATGGYLREPVSDGGYEMLRSLDPLLINTTPPGMTSS